MVGPLPPGQFSMGTGPGLLHDTAEGNGGWGGTNGRYVVQSAKGSGSMCAGLVGKGSPTTELREVGGGGKQETVASGPEGRRRLVG